MIGLILLPLLPLMAAAWFGLLRRDNVSAANLVVVFIAAVAMLTAIFAPAGTFEIAHLLVGENARLALDSGTRPALLLFGGLWLTAGVLNRFSADGRGVTTVLITMSGAFTLALARGEALIYTGLVCTGYGLYALLAAEAPEGWRKAGRALIILLVISDLLIFETVVHAAAHQEPAIGAGLVPLLLVALMLRGSIPPAHAWLPPALSSVRASTALLLLAVPTGGAFFAAIKLLPAGPGAIGSIFPAIALAGAFWVLVAGIAQRQALTTLGYALAASAVMLLTAFPAVTMASQSLAWAGLALLASITALPVLTLQHHGRARSTGIVGMLVIHGLAVMQLATFAAVATPGAPAVAAALIAVAASMLLTISAQRAPCASQDMKVPPAGILALVLMGLALAGLVMAWSVSPPQWALAWVVPLGIGFGLLLHRLRPGMALPQIAPGDLLGPTERLGRRLLQRLRRWCEPGLAQARDNAQQRLISTWQGKAWVLRLQNLEFRLQAWPTTSILVLLLALLMAFLLSA